MAVATDPLSKSTTASYNSNNDPTQVIEPSDGSGQTGPTDSATFTTPSTVAGYQYLPSSMTDAEGNCTAYVYDSAGNLTDTYAGQTVALRRRHRWRPYRDPLPGGFGRLLRGHHRGGLRDYRRQG